MTKPEALKRPDGGLDALPRVELLQAALNDADFLWTQREQDLLAPYYSLDEMAEDSERRLLACLDALVLAGAGADSLLQEALGSESTPAVACASYVLLAEGREEGREAVLAALGASSEKTRAGAVWALGLTTRLDLDTRLVALLPSAPPPVQAALLDILAFRRIDPAVPLMDLVTSKAAEVQAAALRLARYFPARIDPRQVAQAFSSPVPTVRNTALETGLILGVGDAWAAVTRAVATPGEGWRIPACLLALGSEGEPTPLLAALAEPGLKQDAVWALGFSGWRAAADAVFELLEHDEKVAPLAAEAFSAITGLSLSGPYVEKKPGWRPDTPEEESPEFGPESFLPMPRTSEVATWWKDARRRLEPRQRYLGGKPFGWEPLREALDAGSMRRRPLHALDVAVRTRGLHQLNTRAWSPQQRRELHAVGELPRSMTARPFRQLPAAPGSPPSWLPVASPREETRRPRPFPPGVLAITGLGMVSSLGHDVVASCAAARAGLSGVAKVEGDAVGHPVPLALGFSGVARLVRLGTLALADLRQQAMLDVGPRTALFLTLSSGSLQARAERLAGEEGGADAAELEGEEASESLREKCTRLLVPRLEREVPGGVTQREAFFEDAPGFVSALRAAQGSLLDGRVERCVVGAIDSQVDPDSLQALDTLGMLKTPEAPVGLMPGEGAAFLVVETVKAARRRGARIHAYVDALALAEEPFDGSSSPPPHVGVALASVIQEAMGRLDDNGAETGLIVGSLNGTVARAHDWGYAQVRIPRRELREAVTWQPLESFGDVGAATGAFGVCLVARSFARDYAPARGALLWLWGETGTRGAIHVRDPDG